MNPDQLREKNVSAAAYFNKAARAGILKIYNNDYPTGIPSENWQQRIIYGFAEQIFSEYDELAKQYRNSAALSSVAFHARNLLELLVWVIHCLASEENLRRLYEDAGRDGRELLDVFQKWTEAWKSDFGSEQIDEARNRLKASAEEKGVSTIDGSYKSVGAIAALYPKLDSYYKMSNKVLSKCAHPTALTIVGVPNEAIKQLKDSFWGLGCFWFCASIRPIGMRLGLELDDPLGQGFYSW